MYSCFHSVMGFLAEPIFFNHVVIMLSPLCGVAAAY
jgi:hypothetical protein